MNRVQVRVPGKVLLAGEYAVLQGHAALSVAVDRFLEVTLEPRQAQGWCLRSNLWPQPCELALQSDSKIAEEPLLQVAAFAARHFGIPNADCSVQSNLDVRHGLGSSSALRLGVLMAAQSLGEQRPLWDKSRRLEIARMVWHMQREQQGFASGYDVLTQALGGLLLWHPDFENWPGTRIQNLPAHNLSPWLTILVGGRGAPTQAVGTSVRQALRESHKEAAFAEASDRLVQAWLQLIASGSETLSPLFDAIREHRQLLSELPHFPDALFRQLAAVPGWDQRWSIKTSGAGGEDALLLIGAQAETSEVRKVLSGFGWHALPCSWNAQGAELCPGDT